MNLVSVLLLSIALGTAEGFSYDANGCLEQSRILDSCANTLQNALFQEGQNVDQLCSRMVNFLTCVQESNMTCPDLPLLNDEHYIQAIDYVYVQVNNYCPGEHMIKGTCTDDFVNETVKRCTQIINNVQFDQSNEQLCQISKNYVSCLDRAVEFCNNPSLLLSHNIPLSYNSAVSSMKGYCLELQGEQATSGSKPPISAPHPVCSLSNINREIKKCVAHLSQPAEVMAVSGCRQQDLFISCANALSKNCPQVMEQFQALIDSARKTFEDLCSPLTCPQTIKAGLNDVTGYCLEGIIDYDPTDKDYCNKLRGVVECFQEVGDLCPPSPDLHRVSHVTEMLDDMIGSNCGTVEDKRSSDNSHAAEKRFSRFNDGNRQVEKVRHFIDKLETIGK